MMLSHSCNYSIISHKDYLEGEKVSPIKHEYIRGEVYAMAGGSDAHETIAGNLFVLLRNHVRSRGGCRAYIGNMKVKIDAADVYYYPDLLVTCDSRDQNPDDFKQYPRLVVEVLSPSTEAFNRGNKFADYRQIETLEEYVLISQDQINVECFRRNEEGRWVLYPYSKEDELELASIGFKCAIIELYEDVLGLN
ncbi:Uma2 family endonuclease [Limnoraphis robusta Tam1]|uniref:Uma2 family endonuclease n=1 Tax=Limnoraphis robusta TaxID=1118279 RepID=UPI002B2045B0|nr:Uma2 family endonuclease [Limnoraphis robusta]MEA5500164.1 Uma2 family endonuclease [Limnoraphis robusta BA-68 BA1]MEA5541133.1 Uma2 family endonuclease [Limnoraphis robusta Tam1]